MKNYINYIKTEIMTFEESIITEKQKLEEMAIFINPIDEQKINLEIEKYEFAKLQLEVLLSQISK